MHIVFGTYLDGSEWSAKPASLGEIVFGPLGFLAWLEERLGLAGIETPFPERINEYMLKIGQAEPKWCRDSFLLDGWSTAKQLLAWRDELIENGWNDVDGNSPRLISLAAIEATSYTLSPGVPDRLKQVLNELDNTCFSAELRLKEPLELLPYLWQKIVKKLQDCGMNVSHEDVQETTSPEIFRVNAADELTLAHEMARYLAAGDNSNLAIVCEGDSQIVDGILNRFGFGALGVTEPSRWRESLQILPLWLETMWKPFHPQRFLELLLLPNSPIPKFVSRQLVKALQKEPGIGGEEWKRAWSNINEITQNNEHGFIIDLDAELEKITTLKKLLEEDSFNFEGEVQEMTLIQRCDLLAKQLTPQVGKHPELKLVLCHIKTFKTIVKGKGTLNRIALARILDSIISTGTTDSNAQREVNPFAVYTRPGMIDRDFDTIIWWNFVNAGTTKSTYWTDDERKTVLGIDPTAFRERENRSWQNVPARAKKRLILFVPKMITGDAVFPHPLLDKFDTKKTKAFEAAELTDDKGKWKLAERSRKLVTPPILDVPAETAKIAPNNIAPTRALSYSQMAKLLGCPFQWFLDDYIGLSMPATMDLPTGTQMIGTLAHKVVELLFKEKKHWESGDAMQRAEEIFDILITSMAAELLQDERSVELKRLRETLKRAVGTLVDKIKELGLSVIETERKMQGTYEEMTFSGYSDIYLEDATGNPFVIDMKWSTWSDHKKNLEKGKALQLATYAWLLRPENSTSPFRVQCAYFLFPKQAFICDLEHDWQQLWKNAEDTWEQRFEKMHKGYLERGVPENELSKKEDTEDPSLPLVLPAGCKFCNYSALCGVKREII